MATHSSIIAWKIPRTEEPGWPQSMGWPRQEHWSGLPFSSPGDLPDPGIEPVFPAWQADSLPLSHQGSPFKFCASGLKKYSKSLYNGELTLQAVGLYKLSPLINLLFFFLSNPGALIIWYPTSSSLLLLILFS